MLPFDTKITFYLSGGITGQHRCFIFDTRKHLDYAGCYDCVCVVKLLPGIVMMFCTSYPSRKS